MRIEDLMSREVKTVEEGRSAGEAWELMRRHRIRHLVVLREGGVAGVISDRDLGGPRGAALREGKTVADLMAPHVVSAGPSTTVRQAANLLRGHVVGCLPVLDGPRVVGIVTTSDLLDLLGRGVERPVPKATRWTLRHRGRGRKRMRRG